MKKIVLIFVLLNIFTYAQYDVNDAIATRTHSIPQKKYNDTVYRIIHDTVKVIVYKTIKPKPMLFTGKWIITNYGKEIPTGDREASIKNPIFDYNKLTDNTIEFESLIYSSDLDIKVILKLIKIKN